MIIMKMMPLKYIFNVIVSETSSVNVVFMSALLKLT